MNLLTTPLVMKWRSKIRSVGFDYFDLFSIFAHFRLFFCIWNENETYVTVEEAEDDGYEEALVVREEGKQS